MIGWLRGVPHVSDSTLVIRSGDVGYEVHVAASQLARLSAQTTPIELTIYTHVTETALELYGFASPEEKRLFLLLLAVSGVGPRIALAITDRGAPTLIAAVQNAQISFFTSVPRVGKKLAQKIIIDLTSKLGSLKQLQLGQLEPGQQDVVDALVTMGFDESVVQEAMRAEGVNPDQDLSERIKHVLARLTAANH